MVPPPLLGDVHGNYRVHVVGNCGAGKSTVGKRLADLLGLPLISLDALFWKPGWEKSTNEEMRARVEQRLSECPNGWVVDGNYTRRIGTIVEETCTDVIWLDPPLALYHPRIIWRTFLRMLWLEEPCSPGCPESVWEVFFSNESIVWWCITHHAPVRARETAKMARIGLGIGNDVEGQKMRRLGGWGKELRVWFDDVKQMLQRE
ncbi:AAA domain-containing protein [Mycena sanguinolenta]|nr:AAA domain-containing protein [Mycena sanguinolenta]